MSEEPDLVCGCGHPVPAACGAWGCPNCEGDEGPAVPPDQDNPQ